MWFEHYAYGHNASITFWFRKKIPAISLCLVVRPGTYEEIIQPRFIINGKGETDVLELSFDDGDHGHNRLADPDHIIIFDIKHITFKLTDAVFENKWNCVVCTLSGLRNKLFIDRIGIRIFKQGINMEDIQFTNPHLLKNKNRSVNNRGFHIQPMHAQKSLVKSLRLLGMLYRESYRISDNYFSWLNEHMIFCFFHHIFSFIFLLFIIYYIS